MEFTAAASPENPFTESAWCFAFVDGSLLVPEDEPAQLGPQAAAPWRTLAQSSHYLGRLDALDCWVLRLAQAPPGWSKLALRSAMMRLPEPLGSIAGRAAQILEWERSHRFCGVCGSATVAHERERMRLCPSCGHSAYPRLSPAMMALVWRPGAVLLARSPHYAPGMYSALAGFVEAGESLEDCVRREVAEEVGLRVKTLQYYGSQSWPFPHSLMVAYSAEWDGGEIVPQPGEIEDAQWFALDRLPQVPPRFSIAGHLIRDTVARLLGGAS